MWISGMKDLLNAVTVIMPIFDLIHGTKAIRKDALQYLRQEGEYARSPFPPPVWITECLRTMSEEELARLEDCSTKQEAARILREHRHRRLYGEQPRRRGGRTVSPELAAERLRCAKAGMTAKEFSRRFDVCLAYAYAWSHRHGDILKDARIPGRTVHDQAERVRLAPEMTPRQFADHFGITLQAAYAWNQNNGWPLRKRDYCRRR